MGPNELTVEKCHAKVRLTPYNSILIVWCPKFNNIDKLQTQISLLGAITGKAVVQHRAAV